MFEVISPADKETFNAGTIQEAIDLAYECAGWTPTLQEIGQVAEVLKAKGTVTLEGVVIRRTA